MKSRNNLFYTLHFVRNMRYKLWYYARRLNNDLLPFGVSLDDAADDKAPPGPSARSVIHTCTLLLRTLSESLAASRNQRTSKQKINIVNSNWPRALNEMVPLLEATEKFSRKHAC